MTHISKQILSTNVTKRLVRQFAQFMQQSNVKFFDAFFTEAEQIMFMKRLAIVLMLHENFSKYRIAQVLQVSESTVARIGIAYQAGKYDTFLAQSRKTGFDSKKFWDTIEVVLRAGLPPMAGKGRWRGLPPTVRQQR